jgi:hypothetical protein
MISYRKRLAAVFILVLATGLGIAYAGGQEGIAGWEKDSVYNKLYDLDEWDKFKGYVMSIKNITPLPGMATGVAVIVRSKEGETVTVHLGPKSFVNPNTLGLKKGDKVSVRGCWAEIDDVEVFMASKVKKGDYFEYKVRRTNDGTPYWTMSPQELAKERVGQ